MKKNFNKKKLSYFLQPPYLHLPNCYPYYFQIIATDLIFKIYLHSNFSLKYFFLGLPFFAVNHFFKYCRRAPKPNTSFFRLTSSYFATQFQQEYCGLTTPDFSLTFKCTRHFNVLMFDHTFLPDYNVLLLLLFTSLCALIIQDLA